MMITEDIKKVTEEEEVDIGERIVRELGYSRYSYWDGETIQAKLSDIIEIYKLVTAERL